MKKLQTILEAYRNGERDLPGYAELMEIAQSYGNSDHGDWIEWNGGECPAPGSVVEYRLRDGFISTRQASFLHWDHGPDSGDIMSYRVLNGASHD